MFRICNRYDVKITKLHSGTNEIQTIDLKWRFVLSVNNNNNNNLVNPKRFCWTAHAHRTRTVHTNSRSASIEYFNWINCDFLLPFSEHIDPFTFEFSKQGCCVSVQHSGLFRHSVPSSTFKWHFKLEIAYAETTARSNCRLISHHVLQRSGKKVAPKLFYDAFLTFKCILHLFIFCCLFTCVLSFACTELNCKEKNKIEWAQKMRQ